MTDAARFREITVAGPPRLLGQQLGEAARDEVRAFCDLALGDLDAGVGPTREEAFEVARGSSELVRRYAPWLLDEVQGIAEGAGVAVELIMLLQVRNQLAPAAVPGCTSIALPPDESSGRGPIVAQNWDNDPRLDASIVVLTRHPTDRPAVMTVGPAGLIAYIGFNEQQVAACLNTLPAPSRSMGVPHYFTLREIYASRSLQEAVAAVRRAQRAIPASIMLSTPQGAADLEVTIDDVHLLRGGRPGETLTHTNHCLHPDLQGIADAFGDLGRSRARKRRVDALVSAWAAGERDVGAALRDHDAYPRSICRHANEDLETGWWQSVFSVIIEPRDHRMHVSRGTPCNHPYETYSLS